MCHREPYNTDRDEQGLAFDQRALGGEAIDFGELVPKAGIAPERGRDGSQRVAGLHGVNAPARVLQMRRGVPMPLEREGRLAT